MRCRLASSQIYPEWEKELVKADLSPVVGQGGQQLDLGSGVIATVLNPGPACAGLDNPNDHSVVLRLQYGEISFLLPGDIEVPVEQGLAASGVPLAATVSKSPHHGSRTSSSDAFLDAV
jgi:competence protein ComEC